MANATLLFNVTIAAGLLPIRSVMLGLLIPTAPINVQCCACVRATCMLVGMDVLRPGG